MAIRTISVDDNLYEYMIDVSLRETDEMKRLRSETYQMPSRDLASAPEQGQLMAFLLKLMGAKRAIEIGVYTGYTTLALALALPEDGELVACDRSNEWTAIAKRYWAEAGVDGKIDLRLGPALETLTAMAANADELGTYDFAYIDADKQNNLNYIELCLQLLRTGGLIAIDNIFAEGAVIDDKVQGDSIETVREMNRKLLTDERVDLSLVPIGDGMTFLRKR
jgi:predicted O-methyltransferase YrrM